MAPSRLRLRIAVWFALAYLLGLAALNLSLYVSLRLRADRRLTQQMETLAVALQQAVLLELSETPDSGLVGASREALREWAAPPGGYRVVDAQGRKLAERGPPAWLAAADSAPLTVPVWTGTSAGADPVRRLVRWHTEQPRFGVVLMASALGTEEENEFLAWWLGLSLPLVVMLGLGGGYVLSRRALRPIDDLREAIGAIAPTALQQRLVVATPPDELDGVKLQFNGLLDRLDLAQRANRRFLRQAAHQIRTPLTLVMGEASLELQGPASDAMPALRRIRHAAEQMQRRVDDLFLLAEAQAGSPPSVNEVVDLEELLLEAAEAMRGRAHQLGRPLRLRDVAPRMARGNRALLQEAVMELIENALRHGAAGTAVELGTLGGERPGVLVASAGAPFGLDPGDSDPLTEGQDHGLGLAIVQWIARIHGGRLEVTSADGSNEVALILPAA